MKFKHLIRKAPVLSRRAAAAATVALGGVLVVQPAQAAGWTDWMSNLKEAIGSTAEVIGPSAFVIGLGTGLMAILKFRAHSENPQQVPLKQPLSFTIVAIACLALTTVMSGGIETIFGGGANTVSADDSLRSLN